jgi:hypothetical protein
MDKRDRQKHRRHHTEREGTGGFKGIGVYEHVPVNVAGLTRRHKVAHRETRVDERQRHGV